MSKSNATEKARKQANGVYRKNAQRGAENRKCFDCGRKAALSEYIHGGGMSYRVCRYCGVTWTERMWHDARTAA